MKWVAGLVLMGVMAMSDAAGANNTVDTYDVVRQGESFSAEDVQQLEAQLKEQPDDVLTRTKLLGYYFGKQYTNPDMKEPRNAHVLWLIEHAPDAGVLGLPNGQLIERMNAAAYQQGRAAWLVQLEKHGGDIAILQHSAAFFLQTDKELAEKNLLHLKELEPKNSEWPKKLGQLYGLEMQSASGDAERTAAAKSLEQYEAAYVLSDLIGKDAMRADLAKTALKAGDFVKASDYANKMLGLPGIGWNYGNNIHYGNIVLGHVALAEGDSEKAADYLIKAGKTKGSPQLNSFGPNMTLAKALFEAGEKEAVLTYLEECARFWEMDRGRLKKWTDDIKGDKDPFRKARVRF